MADRWLKYTMEPDVEGIYEQVKKMKAEAKLTLTSTNSIPAPLAIGNS